MHRPPAFAALGNGEIDFCVKKLALERTYAVEVKCEKTAEKLLATIIVNEQLFYLETNMDEIRNSNEELEMTDAMTRQQDLTDNATYDMWRVIIWKQWKVLKKRQGGLQKLGIGKDVARLMPYYGDHYQWIVTKTCVSGQSQNESCHERGW